LINWWPTFGPEQAAEVKEIEAVTNHDVKALEYWIKKKLADNPEVMRVSEFIHFACTSEDINNLSHALMLKAARDEVMLPSLDKAIARLRDLAHEHAALPMMSRTHGQPATPTTLGKEMANVVYRLSAAASASPRSACRARSTARSATTTRIWPLIRPTTGKLCRSASSSRWASNSTRTRSRSSRTTRWPSCSTPFARVNTILIDLDRDVWGYISLGFFKQKLKAGEVGSSTMPHKVNPIDFENSEGNLGLANAVLRHLSEKLPISRWQRDLTDSTVLRNMGVALGYTLLAYDSLLRG
jgi:adenylosuccinate lyase